MIWQGVCQAGGQAGLQDERTQLVRKIFDLHDEQPPPKPKLCSIFFVVTTKCI